MNYNKELFGARMENVREFRGLKRSDLARELACNGSYITNYENGITIPVHRLIAVCRVLAVPSDYLMGFVHALPEVHLHGIWYDCITAMPFDKSDFLRMFTERFREIYEDSTLSERKFAWYLGVDETTVAAYMNGEQMPSVNFLYTVCCVYRVSMDYLLGFSDTVYREISEETEELPKAVDTVVQEMYKLQDDVTWDADCDRLKLGAERMRKVRETLNMPRKAFSDKMEVTGKMLWSFESGKVYPSVAFLSNLHSTYGVSLDYLFGFSPITECRIGGFEHVDMLTLKNRIAWRLRKIRNALCLSKSRMANEMHVSSAVIRNYENNGVEKVGLWFLIRLCGVYHVSLDYLLGFSDKCFLDAEV